jgi:hypothetical protein
MKSLWLLLSVVFLATAARAQEPVEVVNVFLDCDRCDGDFVRTEITYVNWVRDRTVADLHVLVSDQDTGGGGTRYTFTFTGLRQFVGREDTLTYTSGNTDTPDEVRRGLTRTLSIGLVPYVASTRLGKQRLLISWAKPEGGAETKPEAAKQKDPWNFWLFTLRLNSYFSGEESQNFLNWNTEIEANRTTEQIKTRIEFNGSFNRSSFTFFEDTTKREVISTQEYYSAEGLAVRSLGQHWSFGVQSEANKASFANISFGLQGGPAIEYSFWPYSEATRRSLVLRYSAGVRRNDYNELTIFDKVKETHPTHSLTSEMELKQRWGSISAEVRYSQYLHDIQFYNIYTFADANVRLFKGFSVNFFGSYSKVRDQLHLPKGAATPEEVLLRQRELNTGYRYWGGAGVSYSFGSIFNNVVNPRFGD